MGIALYVEIKRVVEEFREMTIVLRNMHKTDFPCLEPFYVKHFSSGYKKCNFLNKIIGSLAIYAGISFLVGGTSLAYMVEKSHYPLPVFWQLNIYPATDYMSYGVNMIVQAFVCGSTFVRFAAHATYFYYLASCTVAQIDVTIEIVERHKEIAQELSYEEWVKIVMESTNKAKM